MPSTTFDDKFVDFDAYMRSVYTPPPQLVALARIDPFWSTLGGQADRWGDDGETDRQRAAAAALALPTCTTDASQLREPPQAADRKCRNSDGTNVGMPSPRS